MIYYEQEYHNEQGQTVIQHHIEDGMPPSDFPEFLGVGYIKIPTPMGTIEEKIRVPIRASDLREAFTKFNDTMEKEGPKAAQEAVNAIKQKIMEAQKQQQSKIVVPAGTSLPEFKGIAEK